MARRPTGLTRVNTGNSLVNLGGGPTVVVHPGLTLGSLRNLVTGAPPSTLSTSIAMTTGPLGRAALFSNALDERIVPCSAAQATPNNYATIVHIRRRTTATLKDSQAFGWTKSGYAVMAHTPWSDGTLYFDFGTGSGSGRLAISGQSWSTDPDIFVFRGGSLGQAVWRNGVKVGSDSNIYAFSTGSADWNIGGQGSVASDSEEVYLHAVFDAEWPDEAVYEFYQNPWQILRAAPSQKIFIPWLSAGGGVTVAGDTVAESLSLTAGAAIGGAAADGAIVAESLSVLAGTATGAAFVQGDTSAASLSLLVGTATGGSAAGAATIEESLSVTAGMAIGHPSLYLNVFTGDGVGHSINTKNSTFKAVTGAGTVKSITVLEY